MILNIIVNNKEPKLFLGDSLQNETISKRKIKFIALPLSNQATKLLDKSHTTRGKITLEDTLSLMTRG